MIEGNRLTQEQVDETIKKEKYFKGRERDEKEVLGYYAALEHLEILFIQKRKVILEDDIKLMHDLIMGGGKVKKNMKPSSYRDGQNVISDSRSGSIVYLPPEAKDVSILMNEFILWINNSIEKKVPAALIAAISHYQFATIHPYYDGNGRCARLLTTLIMHTLGYGLKGLYSLDEYYAENLNDDKATSFL